ncbi:hypothetical protein BH23PAT1_BH23PAT1_1910 [soil metagenome]
MTYQTPETAPEPPPEVQWRTAAVLEAVNLVDAAMVNSGYEPYAPPISGAQIEQPVPSIDTTPYHSDGGDRTTSTDAANNYVPEHGAHTEEAVTPENISKPVVPEVILDTDKALAAAFEALDKHQGDKQRV